MLAGKLIGVGAVGLTQIAIWLVAAAVRSAARAWPLRCSPATFAIHFSWIEGVLFPVYFVLGYLLYSSLFAGLAATCETEQELQMYMPLAAAAHLAQLCADPAGHQRLQLVLGRWPLRSFRPPRRIIMILRMASEIAARMAVCGFHRRSCWSEHLGACSGSRRASIAWAF